MTPHSTGNCPMTITVTGKDAKEVVAEFIRQALPSLRAAKWSCSRDLRGTERDLAVELDRLEDILGALENGS